MVPGQENSVSAIEWRDDALWLLDQRALPVQEVWLEHQEVAAVVNWRHHKHQRFYGDHKHA